MTSDTAPAKSSSVDVEEPDESTPLLGLAPIEKINPLGKEVTLLTAFMLNIGQITGSGIYAVPGVILNSVGSIGLLLAYWVITPLFAFAGLLLYSELASMFPHRSGAEVVYLEQAYPRPRFLVSTSFAVITIMTSFSASNAIVFAQYFLTAVEVPITAYSQTVTALAVVFVTVGSGSISFLLEDEVTKLETGVGISTKGSLRAVEILTFFKVLSLIFIVVKSNHAFIGWHNAFNVLGEVRGRDPVRTVRKASILSLSAVSILFFFINVAYVAAVPAEDIRNSGQLVAVLFFQRVFGQSFGTKVFPLLVALSCFGNIIAVTIGQARVIREVARQGLLPYPGFFASTKPFGTPLGPVALKGFLTVIVILAVPARDTFNFVLDLASYPHLIFQAAMVVGVWILRKRRAEQGIPPSRLQARNALIIAYLASSILLLVLPWVPPEPGQGDVSFWYATYCVAGLALIAACGLYYIIWVIVLPKLGGYEIVEEVQELDGGARNTRLVRRYKYIQDEDS
ncbi:hypothetical protein MD484_g3834, partial [Candolleomyces efflorescens]